MELRPYQIEGAAFLASRKTALLADEPGLGKSAQAIAACDALGARVVRVVAPASVVENWRREFRKFSTQGRYIDAMSYERAVRTPPDPCDVLIVDESHYCKSRNAKRTKAVLGALAGRADRTFCLSGTPAPNHPAELYPMLAALAPELLPKGGYWSFVQRYCKTVDNGFGIKILGGKNIDELRAKLQPFMLRRKKTEVAKDLPPLTEAELAVDVGDIDWNVSAFGAVYDDLRGALKAEDPVKALNAVSPHVAKLRRYLGVVKVPPTIDIIADAIDAEKLVVFCYHKDVAKALVARFNSVCVSLLGDTPQGQRMAAVDRFQNDPSCRLFVGQIMAAGTGITLTAASRVLVLEPSWVPAENLQAIMRCHRIGQKDAVLAQYVVLPGTLDEDILRVVRRKSETISQLLDVEG